MKRRIELRDGAWLDLDPSFLGEHEEVDFDALCDVIPLSQKTITVAGRRVLEPRLSAWIGDPEARYTYSGTSFDPSPWPPPLAAIRARVEEATSARFNSVLANLYRDGHDSMGFHADDEPELGPDPIIASVSLGAPRRFLIRHRREKRGEASIALDLGHGSLLVMGGTTQRFYRHAVPKRQGAAGARLNLTFRFLFAAGHPRGAALRGGP